MGVGSILTEHDLAEATRLVGDEPTATMPRPVVEPKKSRRGLQAPEARARRKQTMLERYGVSSFCKGVAVRMIVSDWYRDEFGNKTRTVRGT